MPPFRLSHLIRWYCLQLVGMAVQLLRTPGMMRQQCLRAVGTHRVRHLHMQIHHATAP
jgi:hypothetical protein